MAQYYGVERSEEYLEHYGIKGMKWGVQKARDVMLRDKQAGGRKLDRQYRKAVNKLTKLSDHANLDFQRERFSNAKRRMGISSATSGLLGGAYGGLLASRYPMLSSKQKALLAAGGAVGSAATGALLGSRGITAGLYTTDKGHKKAVDKYKDFQREADKAFKGTKYAGKVKARPLASKSEIEAARKMYNAQSIGGLIPSIVASSKYSKEISKLSNRTKKLKGFDRSREFSRYY